MQIVVKPFPFLNFNDLNFVRKERSKFQNALKQGQIHTISKLILSFPKKKKQFQKSFFWNKKRLSAFPFFYVSF